MDKATADEIKAQHPTASLSIFENEAFGVEFVVKTPAPADFQAYRAQQQSTDDVYQVNRGFIMNHVVHPSPVEVGKVLKDHAGLVEPLARKLLELAGARAEIAVKKL